jgi:hypothetical protein
MAHDQTSFGLPQAIPVDVGRPSWFVQLGAASQTSNLLNQARATVTYYYKQTYGQTGSWQKTWGLCPSAAPLAAFINDLYDLDGVAFGQEMMAIATVGHVKAVSCIWERRVRACQRQKISFVTRVED